MKPIIYFIRSSRWKNKIFPSLNQIRKITKDNINKSHSFQIFRCSLSSLKEFCLLVKEHREDIYNVKCPILILHGENDTVVPLNQMQKIYDTIENNEKKFIIVKNGSHWFLSSKINDEVIDEIKKFALYKIN